VTEVVAENSWCDNNGRKRKRTGGECTLAERLFDASGRALVERGENLSEVVVLRKE